uniref:IST1 homolog n=1 Tax=Globodera pallida TaxID=36090 RepID=A0A183CAG2_GLOPA
MSVSWGTQYSKLKTNLRLASNRLKLLQKKKTEQAVKGRCEIADFLSSDKEDRARIRVETIIREDFVVEAYELLEMYCELLLARFGVIQQMKDLDDGIAEAMLTSILSEYTTKVSQSIMSIEGIYRKVIDPDEDRSAFKDDFTHECLHGDTPRSALMQTTNHRSQQSTHQARSTTASTTIAQLPPEDLTTMPAFFGAKIARPTKRCANNDNTCKNTSIYFISSYLMLIKERPQKFV